MSSFEPLSFQHLMPFLFGAVLIFLLLRIGKSISSYEKKKKIGLILSLIIWVIMFSRSGIKLAEGTYSIQEDLPLYMCRLVTWLLPIALIIFNKKMLKVLYFWVLGGAFQGMITPDISQGFPSLEYLGYFTVHVGLIGTMIYCVTALELKIQWRDFWRAFIIAQFYLLSLIGFNMLIGSNYGYTQQKPAGGSLLDYFGPWPVYLLGAELIMLVSFLVLISPFILLRYSRQRI